MMKEIIKEYKDKKIKKKNRNAYISNTSTFFDTPYDDIDINNDNNINDHNNHEEYYDDYDYEGENDIDNINLDDDEERDDSLIIRKNDSSNDSTSREGLAIHDQLPTIEEARTYASTLRLQERRHSQNIMKQQGFTSTDAVVQDELDVQLEGFIGIVFFLVQRAQHNASNGDVYTTLDDSPYPKKKRVSSRLNEVVEFLSKHHNYSNYEDLVTIGTPQQLACEWIADYDTRNLPIVNTTSFVQRYALAVFYFAFHGSSWPKDLRFLSNDDVCSWFRVGFDELQNSIDVGASCLGTSDIKQLIFPPHYLIGTFPNELRLLSNLERISIFNNPGVSGTFPTILGELSHLNYLSLNYCSFNGNLPSNVFESLSPTLTTLMLSNNNFNGVFPPSISTLTNLKALLLDDNRFVGDFNLLFSNLSKLEILILDDNYFHGDLHVLINNLPSLQVLDISNNQISSTLPKQLFSLENLTVVDLHANFIQGTIPRRISNQHSLQFLALQDNKLTGSIPPSISNLSQYLDHLDLSENSLTGMLPPVMGKLRKLKYLFLANNPSLKEQVIPTFLKRLPLLQDLSLRNTNLKGVIPQWVGNKIYDSNDNNFTGDGTNIGHLMNLVLLDLHDNKLHGTIPSSLGAISSLRFLLLNNNKLHGTIPPSFHALSNLGMLLLEKNNLNGTANAVCNRDIWSDIYANNADNKDIYNINTNASSNNDDNGSDKANHNNIRKMRNYNVISSEEGANKNNDNDNDNDINTIMSSPVSIFITDCGKGVYNDETPEITCTCCTTCCSDQQENCNDYIALGNVDPVWERGYIRTFYDLGYITLSLTP